MIRVIVVGMGPIGVACARAIRAEVDCELTGLIDLDPLKLGMTLSDLTGQPAAAEDEIGPKVTDQLGKAMGEGAEVAVVTTASGFAQVAPLLRQLLAYKLAVVSSCEELAWPWYRHAALADQVDAAAKSAGRAVLGTGVNPGFVMDSLGVVLASMVRRVTSVRCTRRVDAALRRQPLQAKIGATMSVEQFTALAAQGKIGHRGLGESVALLAGGLGRCVRAGTVTEALEPVIADRAIPSALGLIEPGRVVGMHNTAAWQGDGLSIAMDLTMAVGLAEPKDLIEIKGPVPLTLKIPGGVPGDSATVAALINHVPVVHRARGGLLSMLDVPLSGCRGRDD